MENEDIESVVQYANGFQASDEEPINVSRERLMRKAARMAQFGYHQDTDTIQALRAFLEGYGILLSGQIGVGKTFFFECVYEGRERFSTIDMNEAHLWNYEKLNDFLNDNQRCDMLIDDIRGDMAKDYGKTFDPLIVILDNRLNSPARTHITTNLDNDGLINALDYRSVDRIYQLCKPFVFRRKESYRRAKPNSICVRNARMNLPTVRPRKGEIENG